jgi:hypothetical protein
MRVESGAVAGLSSGLPPSSLGMLAEARPAFERAVGLLVLGRGILVGLSPSV